MNILEERFEDRFSFWRVICIVWRRGECSKSNLENVFKKKGEWMMVSLN